MVLPAFASFMAFSTALRNRGWYERRKSSSSSSVKLRKTAMGFPLWVMNTSFPSLARRRISEVRLWSSLTFTNSISPLCCYNYSNKKRARSNSGFCPVFRTLRGDQGPRSAGTCRLSPLRPNKHAGEGLSQGQIGSFPRSFRISPPTLCPPRAAAGTRTSYPPPVKPLPEALWVYS